MIMGHGYYVGGKAFKRKSDIVDHIRRIVERYGDGQDLRLDDFKFMMAVLERHPNADEKAGCGVQSMCIFTNPIYRNNRGFYLTRVDGTGTDWSWTRCMYPQTHAQKVRAALRTLIEPQTIAFKHEFYDSQEPVCELTGKAITFTDSHVDHVPPLTFMALVKAFCEEYHFTLDGIELAAESDNEYAKRLADERIGRLWCDYHQTHAVLRVVSVLGNLSHSKLVMSGKYKATTLSQGGAA